MKKIDYLVIVLSILTYIICFHPAFQSSPLPPGVCIGFIIAVATFSTGPYKMMARIALLASFLLLSCLVWAYEPEVIDFGVLVYQATV